MHKTKTNGSEKFLCFRYQPVLHLQEVQEPACTQEGPNLAALSVCRSMLYALFLLLVFDNCNNS